MTNLTLQDLQDIFGATTSQFPFEKFKDILDKLLIDNSLIPSLETRNRNGQLRKYKGEYYFSLKIGSGNVLFGGNENSPNGKSVPTIKIYKNNRILNKVPLEFTFPSQDDRSPNRICIILSPETIDVIFDIMHEEIEEYNTSHENRLLHEFKPSMDKELTKDKASGSLSKALPIVLILFFFIVIIVLISIHSNDIPSDPIVVSQQRVVASDSTPHSIKSEASVNSKPSRPSKEFHFKNYYGNRVSATVFPATEYGANRKIVIFAPWQDGSDENIYLISLVSFQKVFGYNRGSFRLEDAYKLYDSNTQKKAIVWDIRNPGQRFYCLPIIDIDTGNIVSLVLWLE
jgi:hypothetical protein